MCSTLLCTSTQRYVPVNLGPYPNQYSHHNPMLENQHRERGGEEEQVKEEDELGGDLGRDGAVVELPISCPPLWLQSFPSPMVAKSLAQLQIYPEGQ